MRWPAMTSAQNPSSPDPATPLDPAAPAEHPHNFDVQKELHQRIRNDPDYDDWDYGTEPLPHEHEAWIAARERRAAAETKPQELSTQP